MVRNAKHILKPSKGPIFEPICMGCLAKFDKEAESCHLCGLPICSKDCEFLDQHQFQECIVFRQAKVPVADLKIEHGKPHFVYSCIGIMRMLLKHHKCTEDEKKRVDLLMSHADLR